MLDAPTIDSIMPKIGQNYAGIVYLYIVLTGLQLSYQPSANWRHKGHPNNSLKKNKKPSVLERSFDLAGCLVSFVLALEELLWGCLQRFMPVRRNNSRTDCATEIVSQPEELLGVIYLL